MPQLNKNDFHLTLSTPFQELLYAHFSLKSSKSKAHIFKAEIMKELEEKSGSIYQDICDEKEENSLRNLRWY